MVLNDEMARERLFTMRFGSEESERLDRVAKHYGLNASGVIRMLLKREDDAIGKPAVAPPSVPKRRSPPNR